MTKKPDDLSTTPFVNVLAMRFLETKRQSRIKRAERRLAELRQELEQTDEDLERLDLAIAKRATAQDTTAGMELTQKDMATLLTITPRSLRDSDAPRLESGRYDPRAVVRWFVKHEIAKVEKREADKSDALERYRRVQGDLSLLTLSERRRELVPVAQVNDCFDAIAGMYFRGGKLIRKNWPDAWDIVEAEIRNSLELFKATVKNSHSDVVFDDDADLALDPKPNGKKRKKQKANK